MKGKIDINLELTQESKDTIEQLKAIADKVSSISVASLKPDDVIVLKSTVRLLPEQFKQLKRKLDAIWTGRKSVILEPAFDLQIVRDSES